MLPLALVAAAIFASPGGASAQTSTANGPIATVALSQLGTHGGQCWTWMRQVVQQATGVTIGFDYRQGFFQAGAVEVTAAQAQNGDIIQIDNDADTSPSSYYPGQHTAIILQNLGGGVFNAIDSNQNWDEMVNLRPNYNPYAKAAAAGLTVHIYRIPGGGPGSAGASLASASTNSASWAAGATGTVHADPGCLNLRSSAALGGSIIACLPTGTVVTATSGVVAADGYNWVQVKTSSGSGWVAAMYLSQSSPPPASSSTQAASAPAASSSDGGTAAHVDTTPGCLNVRSSAGLSGAIVGCLSPGSPLTVMASPAAVQSDGYSWVLITNGYVSGWAASEYIVY